MKTKYLFLSLIFIIVFNGHAKAIENSKRKNKIVSSVDYSWVPRISVKNAYLLFREKKAIILHAGGETFNKRHIVGAINVTHTGDSAYKNKKVPKLPKKGVLIITYCYWGGRESGGAGLAANYLKRGYNNVKTVKGGGRAMEKIFDYYQTTHGGFKIVSPISGKITKFER